MVIRVDADTSNKIDFRNNIILRKNNYMSCVTRLMHNNIKTKSCDACRVNPKVDKWYYKSGMKGVKGPFTNCQMRYWFKTYDHIDCYFTVSVSPTGPFRELYKIFPTPYEAFRCKCKVA